MEKTDYTIKIKCRCNACGWEGDFKLCDNGEHEPPTCYICESGSLVVIYDNESGK